MESLGALYFFSARGDVLIQRTYRDEIDKSLATAFRTSVLASRVRDLSMQAPVRLIGDASFVFLRVADVYLVAITKDDANAMLLVSFLSRLSEVVASYCGGELTEESVKGNFVVIYELLDEVLDYGFPQVTDPAMLGQLVFQRGYATKATRKKREAEAAASTLQVTGAVGWRKDSIRYKKNEVFLDVVERVSALVGAQGQVLRADVAGRLLVKSHLSGMPDVKLGLNDAPDDVAFHPCVNLARFRAERVVSFVPPDGEFELMRYRASEGVSLPFFARVSVVDRGRTRAEVSIVVRSTFPAKLNAKAFVATLPVPSNASRAKFTLSGGKAKYDPKRGALVWKIRKFAGETEHTLFADVGFLASVKDRGPPPKLPLALAFEIPMFTASPVRVQYLKVWEKEGYKVEKWVRKLTSSADYNIRF